LAVYVCSKFAALGSKSRKPGNSGTILAVTQSIKIDIMKTNILSTLAIAFLALVFASCEKQPSDAVDQDRIRTDYELFYDKNTDKTTAIAAFKFGQSITGTQLELSNPAEVRFNNDVLTFNRILGRYEKEYTGFISTGTFTYKDTKGKVLTNTVPAIKPIDFPASPSVLSISKAQGINITWEGTPLAQNDGVGLLVAALPFTETTVNATFVRITSAQIQPAATGAHIAYMDRWTLSQLQQQTSNGGSITSKYRARNKNVEVTQ
jgi:hypothetical protein